MRQLWNSDLELVVASGFLYLPLLLDPDIEKETQALFQPERLSTNPASKTIIRLEDRYFVKALSLHSLLENYNAINAYDYKRLRNDCLRQYHLTSAIDDIFIDETFKVILFQVMPYFIRKNRGLVRKKMSDAELLDFIGEKINIPVTYYQDAKNYRDSDSLKEILRSLEDQKPNFKTPTD
ncbi:MAG: hypothetical protein KKH68_09325, partial [Proteobacteria bacterium]|nr:hypothetical protein [Pseudomonadota bacterium]